MRRAGLGKNRTEVRSLGTLGPVEQGEGRGRKLYRPSVSDWGWKGNCWGSVKEVPSGSASFVPDTSSFLKFNLEESLYDRLHRVVKYLLVV